LVLHGVNVDSSSVNGVHTDCGQVVVDGLINGDGPLSLQVSGELGSLVVRNVDIQVQLNESIE
jgi:hypothetical protein